MADDLTAKERTRPGSSEGESHSERWTRAAPTRPDLYRRREVRRENLRHAGAPEMESLPRSVRAEGIPGVDRAQRHGGQEVPRSGEYGEGPPRAGVSATGTHPTSTDPAHSPAQTADDEHYSSERRSLTMSDKERMTNQRPAEERSSDEGRGLARREERGVSRYGYESGYSPFELMRRFSEDVDRMFSSFGFPSMESFGLPFERGRTPGRQIGSTGPTAWSPSVDILTRGDDLVIHAELPGIKPEEVDVEVEGNNLIIRGETRAESQNKDQGYWYSERRYGSFYRTIPLPQGVNPDNAQAQFSNGVLEVTLPGAARSLQPQRRRIQIQGAVQQARQGEQGQQQTGTNTQPTQGGESRTTSS